MTDNLRAHGLDMASVYEQLADAEQVNATGIEFVIHKATEGTRIIDPDLTKDCLALRKTPIKIGLYLFYRANVDLYKQALYFHEATKHIDYDFWVIDWETTDGVTPASRIIEWVIRLSRSLKELTGKKGVLYSGMWYLRQFTQAQLTPLMKEIPLIWNAAFWWESLSTYNQESIMRTVEKPALTGPIVLPWPEWFIWQWTARGRIAGITGACDRNIAQGTIEEFCTALGIDSQAPRPGYLWDIYRFLKTLGYQGSEPEE